MNMSKTSLLRWSGRVVVSGLLVTVLHLENAKADLVQAPAGTCCQPININNLEDARGYCDSCLQSSQAGCPYPYCAICYVPDGWYCADYKCPNPELPCYGVVVQGNVKDSSGGGQGCKWGYGNDIHPRPNGECYCYYDEQQTPGHIPVYDCSSSPGQ